MDSMSRTAYGICVLLLAGVCSHSVEAHKQEPEERAAGISEPKAAASPLDSEDRVAAMQESMTPGPQHEALASLEGRWGATIKHWTSPGDPPSVSKGIIERRMILDGRVLEERFSGELMGHPIEGIAHTGYDNTTEAYWSTWTSSLSTGVEVYAGEKKDGELIFETEIPDPMAGGPFRATYHVRYPRPGKEVITYYVEKPGAEAMQTIEQINCLCKDCDDDWCDCCIDTID
jgi:hypothetical protein